MKKVLKKIAMGVASFVVAIAAFLPTLGAGVFSSAPITVSAGAGTDSQPDKEPIFQTGLADVQDKDDEKHKVLPGNNKDNHFRFNEGVGFRFEPDRLTFQIDQIDDYYDERMNAIDERSALSLTLYRTSGDNESTPICEVLIQRVRSVTADRSSGRAGNAIFGRAIRACASDPRRRQSYGRHGRIP